MDGACQNPDGFGYAIMDDKGGIISNRTMKAEDSVNEFLEMRAKYPDGYAMWHCRIATHGVKTVDNCHPFTLGDDKLTYLGHNGILSLTPKEGDTRSDTAIFAQDILPTIGGVEALDNPFLVHLLEKWMLGSKVVVITVNPLAKKNIYILNKSAGNVDKDEIWWSNASHRGARARKLSTQNYASGGYWDNDYLTKRWNTTLKRDEIIIGMFKQGEFSPTECTDPAGHPLANYEKDNGYCYKCTLGFDKELKVRPTSPDTVWLITKPQPRNLERGESVGFIYTMLDSVDMGRQAQTKLYFHAITKECEVIGKGTKWAYCFKHEDYWNDVYGRTPLIHDKNSPTCNIPSPAGSPLSWCSTHQVAINEKGEVRDPKALTEHRPPSKRKGKSHLHQVAGIGTEVKRQVKYSDASLDDVDNPEVDIICDACKGTMDWEDAITYGYCNACGACMDCKQDWSACLCYIPQTKDSQIGY